MKMFSDTVLMEYNINNEINKQTPAVNERFHTSGGVLLADSFVGICKFIARPNLCAPPACVKPRRTIMMFP